MNKLPQFSPSKKVCPRDASCWACNGDDCDADPTRTFVIRGHDGKWIPLWNDLAMFRRADKRWVCNQK